MEAKLAIILGVIFCVFALLFLSLMTQGIGITTQFIYLLAIVACIALFLAGVVWVIIYIITPRSPNLQKLNQKDKIESGKISKSHFVRDLWLRGDKEHMPVCIGRIVGYTTEIKKVSLNTEWLELNKEKKDELAKDNIKELELELTTFAVKYKGLRHLLTPLQTVIAVAHAYIIKRTPILDKKGKPTGEFTIERDELKSYRQHSGLSSDVSLYGVALNRVGLDFVLPQFACSAIIDQVQTGDIFRKFSYYVLNELATVNDKAMQANAQHQIELENRKLIDAGRDEERRT